MRLERSPLSTISSAFLSNHFTFDHIKMKENVPLCSFMCYMYVCMALSLSLVTTLFLNYLQKNSSTNLNITPAILIPLWFSIHHFQLAIYYHLFFSLVALDIDEHSFHLLIYPPIHTSSHPSMLKPFSLDFCDIIFSWVSSYFILQIFSDSMVDFLPKI